MEIVQRQSAPRPAQHAEPCHTILGIQQCTAERNRVLYLGTVSQLLELDGAESNPCLTQRGSDGCKRLLRSAQYSDPILGVLTAFARLLHLLDQALLVS